jgi:putative transposase
MLNIDELKHWLSVHCLTDLAIKLIETIRASEPSRAVQGGRSNVCGRYPSRKMGLTIQFESHRNELAFIYEYEHDLDVLEYYDQPPQIKLNYLSKNDRPLGILHTPDFFVIRKDKAGWEECKTEEELKKLAEKSPNRYFLNENGKWLCPPGEAYASSYGLYYKLRVSTEINWVWQRNILFLEDYLGTNSQSNKFILQSIVDIVKKEIGISLQDLFHQIKNIASKDDIYRFFANNDLYIDMGLALLIEPQSVRVFATKEEALAYSNLKESSNNSANVAPTFINFSLGAQILWDGRIWKIINIGETLVSLLNENGSFAELPLTVFDSLLKEGRFTGQSLSNISEDNVSQFFSKASAADLRIANYRHKIVCDQLMGITSPAVRQTPIRTLRRWIKAYKYTSKTYGNGYIGLLPNFQNCGFRGSKLPEETIKLMAEFIQHDYETLKQKRKFEVWAAFKSKCEQMGILYPSYKTFCRAVNNRDFHNQVLKRQGLKASYQNKPFYWLLDQQTARHGDRPFEICHIDHTELDIELICSRTYRNLGRPWVTFLTDAFSRRILSFFLTFDEPSYRSCMMVIRECVRMYGRFPQVLIVDNGPEFRSTFFESLLARYECTKKHRPPAQSRFGSVCERLFGTANTQFVYNLKGNTQIIRNVRQVNKQVDPKQQAIWTFASFNERLSEYAHNVYDNICHPTLGQSPKEAYTLGILETGSRLHKYISYDKSFQIATLPTTQKGDSKVIPGRGVKINYIMYWNDEFRNRLIENSQVQVRYDPYNIGVAYAYVDNKWHECISEFFTVFQGRSEKELKIATQELIAKKRKHSKGIPLSARRLADFLQSLEAEEGLLLQNLRDYEVRSTINFTAEKLSDNHVPTPKFSAKENNKIQPVAEENNPYVKEIMEEYEEYEEY